MGAGNERAAETSVDSGTLNPLRKLSTSNLPIFNLIMISNCDIYQPPPRHIEMIQDLRYVIERNWLLEQESQQFIQAMNAAEPQEAEN